MEVHIILIVLAAALVEVLQAQSMVPCDPSQSPEFGPKLPVLPNQFQVHIEANIVQKHHTINMVEYYDYPNNRGVIDSFNRTTGERIRMVLNFDAREARYIYENNTCTLVPTNSSGGPFNFMRAENGTHIRTVRDLLYFGDDMGEEFISGEEEIRGIPVNHWRARVCIPHANGTFDLDYYFSLDSNYTIDGAYVQVPVRAVINGTGNAMRRNGSASDGGHSFYHIYEFTGFHPGPIKDQSVFEIPVGTYCHSNMQRKPAPKLPQQFTTGLEAMLDTDTNDTHLVNQQMYYDGPAGVMRVDLASPSQPRDIQMYGNRPITVIHDMKNNMRYIIDKWEGNCTVMGSRPTLEIVTPEDILATFNEAFLYQGKKTYRGTSVESWAYYDTHDNITEVLFKQMPPSDQMPQGSSPAGPQNQVPAPGRGANVVYAPVGIYARRVSAGNQPHQIARFNLYGFSQAHPDPDVFDVSECYQTEHHYLFMMIKTDGMYDRDVLRHKREFVTAVRTVIAQGAGVTVMRIASVMVEGDTKTANQLLVYFKLLDNSLSGLSNDKLPTLAKAKLELQSSVMKGLKFDVQYPTMKKNFKVQKDSLWEIRSTMDKRQDTSSPKQYSAGSMAGLGIGMIIVGALLGLGAAYIIYKRVDTSVPYEHTD